jgi:imidazole glycerol-phosphate synthase subunit HisH
VTARVVIVDAGLGNVGSIANMLRKAGGEPIVSGDPADLLCASKIILPGVGAFDNGVTRLREAGLWEPLHKRVTEEKVPVLGICLGMQLFCRRSEEGRLPGFGWIAADTLRFRTEGASGEWRIPHMGWNELVARQPCPLLEGYDRTPLFYFVHGYHLVCDDPTDVAAEAHYVYPFPAVVRKGNLYATQFHPEKSHKFGLRLLGNFLYKC